MGNLDVVGKNNIDDGAAVALDRLAEAEAIVDECVITVTTFFICAHIARAVNMLRNGSHPDAVRAEMRKVNGFADYGYDEP